jgi:hypothetical protein
MWSGFIGLNENAEADSAVSMTPRKPYQNFNIIFSHQEANFQHNTIFEKFGFRIDFTQSGPYWGCLLKKTEGRKSRDTVPWMVFCTFLTV